MHGFRSGIRSETGQEQYVFIQDIERRNTIVRIRKLLTQAIQMQKSLFLYIIDYTNLTHEVQRST